MRSLVTRAARLLSSLAAVGIVLAIVAAVAGAAGLHYKTGTYTAKTSQGTTFKFKVIAHTATNNCGKAAGVHCFVAVTYPHADQSCGGAKPYDAGIYPLPNGFISTAGRFSYRQSNPSELFQVTIKGAKATGSFRTRSTTDLGNGPVTCDTGTVTWKATRTG